VLEIELQDFPYKTPRIGQVELAKFIAEKLGKDDIIVVAAPTGFGKTISTLYAIKNLIRRGEFERALYVVRTRNELDSFIREARLLEMRFAALYSGKRMCPLIREVQFTNEVSPEGFWLFCNIMRVHGKCRFYPRLQLFHTQILISTISDYTDHYNIARGLAEKLGVCPYFAMIEALEHVEAFALTYPYIFKESIWRAVLGETGTSHTVLIVDEAHNLLNVGNIMGDTITAKELSKALLEVGELSISRDISSFIKGLAERVFKAGKELGDRGYKHLDKSELNIDEGLVEKLKDAAFNVMAKAVLNTSKALSTTLPHLASVLELALDESYETFLSRDYHGDLALSVMPSSFKPLKRVLERFPSIVALSATPPSSRFFESIVKVEKKVHVVDVEEWGAKNFLKENTATVIYTNATTSYRSRNPEMFKKYAQLIEAVYNAMSKGILLTVYPSYEVLRAIVSELPDTMNIVVESPQPLSEIVRQVKMFKKATLNIVAGGRLAEGIEVVEKGESLIKVVIVVGVPYPQPDDYAQAIATEINKIGSSSADFFREIALIRVLQAVGRAVRSEEDRAVIVLADNRYVTQPLLPGLGLRPRIITRRIDEIAKFIVQLFKNEDV
jgi:DNA excision repair protein ERCC-2